MKIGEYNRLKVVRLVDFGAYLDNEEGGEVLMPLKYIDSPIKPGDRVDVFVYTDSDDRPVATTEKPYATVGQFAFLQVSEVNKIGAFLDWGLASKQLLVPFNEQKVRLRAGGIYPVYVYLDDATKRVVASAKIGKFMGNTIPRYHVGEKVKCLVYGHTELGYKAIVDNLFAGMIYANKTYVPIEIGETVMAVVTKVREDGKIDLRHDRGKMSDRVDDLTERVIALALKHGGKLPLNDSSDPAEIKRLLECSKKDFKRAVGQLYKEHRLSLDRTTGVFALSEQ